MKKLLNGEKLNFLNKSLLIILFIILAFFVLTTIIGFSTGKARLSKNLRKPEAIPEKSESVFLPFAGLGRIRASTKPSEKTSIRCPVIISPWFNYDKNDKQFFEELSKKAPQLKSTIISYFSQNTKEYFFKLGEEKVKLELLNLINEKLVLGKIEDLFFSEYIFLD